MARIYPFRAWRYNPSAVRLEDVVTQPYDKISPSMQQAYYQRSPFNLVRIILGLPELFDAERGESVYTRAARDFSAWREQGVLIQEKDPCVFAYSQRFTVPGTDDRQGAPRLHRPRQTARLCRTGRLPPRADTFQAQERPAQPAQGHPRPLRPDLHALLRPRRQRGKHPLRRHGPADAEVTDEYGVLHSLWRVSDPAAIRLLAAAMDDKKLIIADGHHRYETALNYSKEHAAESDANSRAQHQPVAAARLS